MYPITTFALLVKTNSVLEITRLTNSSILVEKG